jgi:hypothetical protein
MRLQALIGERRLAKMAAVPLPTTKYLDSPQQRRGNVFWSLVLLLAMDTFSGISVAERASRRELERKNADR